MAYFERNNDFFGYTGTIDRKNYSINMAILLCVFFGLSCINFSNFWGAESLAFLYTILGFLVSLVKFVALFAMLSLVYRRFMDISKSKSLKFAENIRKLFVILFVIPVIYVLCLQMFIYNIPVISYILNLLTFFALVPLAFITSILIAFLK